MSYSAQDWVLIIGAVGAAVSGALTVWKGNRSIKKELTPNGGSSLRDAVDRIERLVEDHVASDERVFAEMREDARMRHEVVLGVLRVEGSSRSE